MISMEDVSPFCLLYTPLEVGIMCLKPCIKRNMKGKNIFGENSVKIRYKSLKTFLVVI